MTLPITVAVCTYNEEARVADCLEAVLANDPAQIVVVDGGSTDRTVEAVCRMGIVPQLLPGRGLASAHPRRLGRDCQRCQAPRTRR